MQARVEFRRKGYVLRPSGRASTMAEAFRFALTDAIGMKTFLEDRTTTDQTATYEALFAQAKASMAKAKPGSSVTAKSPCGRFEVVVTRLDVSPVRDDTSDRLWERLGDKASAMRTVKKEGAALKIAVNDLLRKAARGADEAVHSGKRKKAEWFDVAIERTRDLIQEEPNGKVRNWFRSIGFQD